MDLSSRPARSDLGSRRADRVVVVYLAVATAWIVVSGALAIRFARLSTVALAAVELGKGLLFVVVTALVLRVALRRWVARVEAAANAEHAAAEQLRQAAEERTAFVDAVSHELRTPLTSIVGLSQTVERLLRAGEHGRVPELAERLVVNAARLESLVLDLLEAGSLHHRVNEPRFRRIEIEELVLRTVGAANLGGRELETTGAPTYLDADVAKLERCLQLLLTNVVRHTPPRSRVWVSWAEQDDRLALTVEDDGPGLPHHLLDTAFAPFVQGSEASASPSPGIGVGLTLVAQYVQLHGGVVSASARPGGGARVEMLLPSRQAAAVDAAV